MANSPSNAPAATRGGLHWRVERSAETATRKTKQCFCLCCNTETQHTALPLEPLSRFKPSAMAPPSHTASTAGAIKRIAKEIAHIQNGSDLSLAVACRDDDVRQLHALIVGPPETPYEFGFFEFIFKFPRDYPIKSPHVTCITTNSGRTRFGPNIYNTGKVCLSILGTWHGEKGEEWSSAQGLESVLLSIQSLMSSNPMENEPGFEEFKLVHPEAKAYAWKIQHETLRISVIERMEKILKIEAKQPKTWTPVIKRKETTAGSPSSKDDDNDDPNEDDIDDLDENPDLYEYDAMATYNRLNPAPWDPFADLLCRRFLWYYDSYIAAIDKASPRQKDGTAFPTASFEYGGNGMPGAYAYENLRLRLDDIRAALSAECTAWTTAGAAQVAAQTQLATQLAFQFTQLQHHYSQPQSNSGARLDLSLPNKTNPFAWRLTLFGAPSTNLDAGVFNIALTIPPTFPAAWPRVYVETPIFHARVSATTGALAYFPTKPDEIASHVAAIVAAIEDAEPKFEPRAAVNPEAAALLWGDEGGRKVYRRRLRRSAQESSEF